MDHHIQIETAPLNILAEPAVGVRFVHGTAEALGRLEVLASNIDVRLVAPDGIRRDDHPFEKGMGIPLEEVSILKGPGLSLVGVDHEILGLWGSPAG